MNNLQVKPLSFSAIKQFEKCPYEFYCMKYHSDKYPYQQNAAAARGEAIHKELEEYVKSGAPLGVAKEFEPLARNIVAQPGKKHPEYKMAINWKCEPVAYFRGKDIWLRGQFDLMVDNPDTTHILDYKTGKSKYADIGQLECMAMMTFIHFPKVNKIKGSLVFLDEKKLISNTYERDKQQDYIDRWLARSMPIVEATRACDPAHPTGAFPQREQFLCNFCSVTDCPLHP